MIAIHPPGAGLDDFDWRISMAGVAADGPFSRFPGIDRTLLVLDGGPLELAVSGRPPARLDRRSVPFGFPGDDPAAATLLGAPVTDLNVMTRRGRFAHAVRRLELAGPDAIGCGHDTCVVFCWAGEVDAGGTPIGPHDALLLQGPCSLAPRGGPATVVVICIRSA